MNRRRQAAVVLLLSVVSLLAGYASTSRFASPDGVLTVEVRQEVDPPDRIWEVTVRSGSRFIGQRWVLGCLSDDGPDGAFKDITWSSSRTLVVRTTGNDSDIAVTLADSGEPIQVRQSEHALRSCP